MTSLSLAHRAWRHLPASQRRALLLRAAAALSPRPDRPAPAVPPGAGLLVGGEIGRASGLGEGARLMIEAARTLGIATAGIEAGIVPGPERHELAFDAGGAARLDRASPLVLHVNAPVLPPSLLRLGRRVLRGRRVIGYWAWELPVVPPSWRVGAAFVHEVWVPSHFTAAALAGLMATPIRVVPHPLAARRTRPSALTRADFGLPDDALVTTVSFSLASSFERKNPLAAISAHRAAFGGRADRILLLKLGKTGHNDADFRRIVAAAADLPNVRIETRTFSTADAMALLQHSDIVLSLHRSEGFGLVPAEAMILGKPVVATDWSGTTDFLDAGCGCPIPCRLVPARDGREVFEAPGAVWAEADIGAAARALAALAADATLRARIGAMARARAAERFGVASLRAALAAIGVAGR